MAKKTKPDCRTCGACCVSTYDQTEFCDVSYADMKRMGLRLAFKHVALPSPFDRLASVLGGSALPDGAIRTKWRLNRAGPFKGLELCACVFLRGSVLHRTSCRIYDKRPHTCRAAVHPGTKTCHQIRDGFREMADEARRQVDAR